MSLWFKPTWLIKCWHRLKWTQSLPHRSALDTTNILITWYLWKKLNTADKASGLPDREKGNSKADVDISVTIYNLSHLPWPQAVPCCRHLPWPPSRPQPSRQPHSHLRWKNALQVLVSWLKSDDSPSIRLCPQPLSLSRADGCVKLDALFHRPVSPEHLETSNRKSFWKSFFKRGTSSSLQFQVAQDPVPSSLARIIFPTRHGPRLRGRWHLPAWIFASKLLLL